MTIKVFVGNIPQNCTQESIQDLFGPYGKIREVCVLGKFAFVHFVEKSDAENACKDLNRSKMFGQTIIVEISKKQGDSQGSGGGPDRRRRDRPSDRRGNDIQPNFPVPAVGGGILGLGPNALNPLGILSQVNTLAALGQQNIQNDLLGDRSRGNNEQRDDAMPPRDFNNIPPRDYDNHNRYARESESDRPDPDVRVRREVVHTRDIPERHRMGLSDGYVIYERYYVDNAHPLLKGLRLGDLPRMGDSYLSRDAPRADREYNSGNSYRDIDGRDRSPLSMRENAMREREFPSRDYGRDDRMDPYQRR